MIMNKIAMVLAIGFMLTGCAQQQKKVDQVVSGAPVGAAVADTAVTEIAVPPPVAAGLQAGAGAKAVAAPAVEAGKAPVSVEIADAVFCTAVKDRVPQDGAEAFPRDVKKVFFFNRVVTSNHPTSITHVWYWNERKMAEVPLDVRSANWRTWSSKRIDRTWTGSWAVKVLDANGEVVTTKNFQIQ